MEMNERAEEEGCESGLVGFVLVLVRARARPSQLTDGSQKYKIISWKFKDGLEIGGCYIFQEERGKEFRMRWIGVFNAWMRVVSAERPSCIPATSTSTVFIINETAL